MKQMKRSLVIVSVIILLGIGLLNAFTIETDNRSEQTTALSQINPEENSTNTFFLPASLVTIEEDAFEGTLAEQVILQEKVESVGERAFSEMESLNAVIVPKGTNYIAENAFEGSANMVFITSKGSYAEDWARRKKISVVYSEVWMALLREDPLISELSLSLLPSSDEEKESDNAGVTIFGTQERDKKIVLSRKKRSEMDYQIGLFP